MLSTHTLLILTISLLSHAQFCYYPGENASAQDHRPCDPYAETSLCCPQGWTCFSNKLCVVTDSSAVKNKEPVGRQIRGTCTNPRWDDEVCGDFCLNDPVNDNDGLLIPCGNNVFCCSPDGKNGLCNCESQKGVFSLTQGTAQTVIGAIGSPSTSTSIVPVSSSTTTSASPTTSASSTTSSSLSTHTALATSTPIAAHSSEHKKGELRIGLGVSFGFLALVALMTALWYGRKAWLKRHPLPPRSTTSIPLEPTRDFDNNTIIGSQETKVNTAPFPNPYSPSSSPPPMMNRSQVLGPRGIGLDNPYGQNLGAERFGGSGTAFGVSGITPDESPYTSNPNFGHLGGSR